MTCKRNMLTDKKSAKLSRMDRTGNEIKRMDRVERNDL
jgi:hypothetical protein